MIVYIPFILMVLSLLGFLTRFIYFSLSKKVSLRSVKSPLLFFDFCFFNKNKLANFSMRRIRLINAIFHKARSFDPQYITVGVK